MLVSVVPSLFPSQKLAVPERPAPWIFCPRPNRKVQGEGRGLPSPPAAPRSSPGRRRRGCSREGPGSGCRRRWAELGRESPSHSAWWPQLVCECGCPGFAGCLVPRKTGLSALC